MDYWERHENPRDDDPVEIESIERWPLHKRLWSRILTMVYYTVAVAIPVRWVIFRNRWRIRLRCYLNG